MMKSWYYCSLPVYEITIRIKELIELTINNVESKCTNHNMYYIVFFIRQQWTPPEVLCDVHYKVHRVKRSPTAWRCWSRDLRDSWRDGCDVHLLGSVDDEEVHVAAGTELLCKFNLPSLIYTDITVLNVYFQPGSEVAELDISDLGIHVQCTL